MATDFKPHTATTKRNVRIAKRDDKELGPLKLLPGTWANIRPEHRLKTRAHPKGDPFISDGTLQGQGLSPFDGRGWNLIALPFIEPGERRDYRLLMNQYNEVLNFSFVDDQVPNRGITGRSPGAENADQKVAALDYTQMIKQIAADDFADSRGLAGEPELPIHHEPGFFLHMKEQNIEGINIARLATIPHGNSATALGTAVEEEPRPPEIGDLHGFPEGVTDDIVQAVNNADPASPLGRYLLPYKHFTDNPFKGVLKDIPGFPGFSPANANNLLQDNSGLINLPNGVGNVVRTTTLPLDTDVLEGGIVNIPFVERQADAALMRSTFWLMELDEMDENNEPRLVLAYSQFIFLDFFERPDGSTNPDGSRKLIRWPHISINMMEKIEEPDEEEDHYTPRVMVQA